MARHTILALIGLLALAGCAATDARDTRIADLRAEPGRFEDASVRVDGVVTSSWALPFVPFQLYSLDDGSGEITVLSRSDEDAPRKGTRVQVQGTVSEVGVLGGHTLGLHIKEKSREIRGS